MNQFIHDRYYWIKTKDSDDWFPAIRDNVTKLWKTDDTYFRDSENEVIEIFTMLTPNEIIGNIDPDLEEKLLKILDLLSETSSRIRAIIE